MKFTLECNDCDGEESQFQTFSTLDEVVDYIEEISGAERQLIVDDIRDTQQFVMFGSYVCNLVSRDYVNSKIDQLEAVKPTLYKKELSDALEAWVPKT